MHAIFNNNFKSGGETVIHKRVIKRRSYYILWLLHRQVRLGLRSCTLKRVESTSSEAIQEILPIHLNFLPTP